MTLAQQQYRAYLRSAHWTALRRRILDRAQEHCEQCGYFCGRAEAVLDPVEISWRVSALRANGIEPCEVCGWFCRFRSTEDKPGGVWLEIHHLTYERLGCEDEDDLIALCCYCHDGVTEREQLRAYVRRVIAPDLPKAATHVEVWAAMLAHWSQAR